MRARRTLLATGALLGVTLAVSRAEYGQVFTCSTEEQCQLHGARVDAPAEAPPDAPPSTGE